MPTEDEISGAAKAALQGAIRTGILAQLQADGGNPDPNYNEFWVEMHPAPSPTPGPTPEGFARVQDILSTHTVRPDGSLVADDWSENVWTEVAPGWAEMNPTPPPEQQANSVITMSARAGGVKVSQDFYKEALRNVAAEFSK